jgi:hypothetical protein
MVDSFIIEGGKTYSIPSITNNPDLGSDYDLTGTARQWFEECRNLYYNWWKNEHHKFTLEEFFTYGKSNDYQMIRKVNYKKETKKNLFYT